MSKANLFKTVGIINHNNMLTNTYLELAEYFGSPCRLSRHRKISAPVHSFEWNSLSNWVHCPNGTQSVKSLTDII